MRVVTFSTGLRVFDYSDDDICITMTLRMRVAVQRGILVVTFQDQGGIPAIVKQ